MRISSFLLVCFTILGLAITACSTKEKEVSKPLNVIVILADDLGYEAITANGGKGHPETAVIPLVGLSIVVIQRQLHHQTFGG